MIRDLAGKKILILGGSSEAVETVRNANEMGMQTIVVDPSPIAPAKKLAWKSYDVDALDVEALVRIGEEEQIDGVSVGLSERLLEVYSIICSRLNLPSYCTLEQIAVFGDKIAFKNKCREYGISVVNDYSLEEKIPYPVLVKPADSSGSKGISICNNEKELHIAIERAESFSRSGRYLIEDYLESEQITAIYTILNGVPYLSLLNDRFVVKPYTDLGSIGIAVAFPSMYADLYLQTVHTKMSRLLKDMGFENAPVSLQAFVDKGVIRFYDPALRIGGGRGYLINEALTGFNIQKALLRFAVTGSMLDDNESILVSDDDWKLNGKYSLQPNLIIKTGTIGRITGMDKLSTIPGLISATQMREQGEVISLAGTLQQTAIRLHFIADTLDELLNSYHEALDIIKITNEEGEDMMLPPFDFSAHYDDYVKR